MLVSPRTEWPSLDSLLSKIFKVSVPSSSKRGFNRGLDLLTELHLSFVQDYLSHLDPAASLGLTSESLHTYQLGLGEQRVMGGDRPQASPYQCFTNGAAQIFVTLKG